MNKLQPTRSLSYVFSFVVWGSTLGCQGIVSDEGSDDTATGGSALGETGGTPGASGGAASGGTAQIGTGGHSETVINPACPGDAAQAYDGIVEAIPGTVQAEDFDPEGYSDSSEENEGGMYRDAEGVDIKAQGGGFVLGWMTSGEWMDYTVNVATEGDYSVVALAGAVDAGRTIELSSCDTSLGTLAIPSIADWGTVSMSDPVTIHLGAGIQVLRVTVGSSDYLDLDALSFTLESAGGGSGGAPSSGGTGSGGAASGGAGTGGNDGTVPKFVGNITTGNGSMDVNGMVFSDYWDQVTPENAGKWGSVQGSAGANKNWSTLDSIYDYAEEKGIIFKQHTFVWGSQQPSGNLTENDVKTWMSEFCERYPNTRLIDVVNEPPPHTTPSYANNIGGGTNSNWAWVTNAFTWAHEACPNAILILNDYNNVEYSDQTQHFIDIAKAVQDAGGPIHALGAQSHGLGGNISADTMKNLLTKMHDDTGLPVYITEYDIGIADDNAQANKYKEHFPFFMDTEWIHGVTVWGWIDGRTWVNNTGLVKDTTPRAAMTWLMDYLGRPSP